jgi:hypothetical protein
MILGSEHLIKPIERTCVHSRFFCFLFFVFSCEICVSHRFRFLWCVVFFVVCALFLVGLCLVYQIFLLLSLMFIKCSDPSIIHLIIWNLNNRKMYWYCQVQQISCRWQRKEYILPKNKILSHLRNVLINFWKQK